MGCLCSKEKRNKDKVVDNKKKNYDTVQLVAPLPQRAGKSLAYVSSSVYANDGSACSKATSQLNSESITVPSDGEEKKDNFVAKRERGQCKRNATMDVAKDGQNKMVRVVTLPHVTDGEEQVAGEWPSWLASVAPEAINGSVPRPAESFEKLEKVSFV